MSRLAIFGFILIALSIIFIVVGSILTTIEPNDGYPMTISASAGLIGGCILVAGGHIATVLQSATRK